MENKIINKLEIIGSDDEVKEVRETLHGEPDENYSERYIDFNKIIKMPEELNIESSCNGKLMQFLLFGEEDGIGIISHEEAQDKFNELDDDEKNTGFNLACQYYSNIQKFGHANKYSWIKKNWRTLNNAFDQVSISENQLSFMTISNGVPYMIEKLSLRFPAVQFKYNWVHGSSEYKCTFVEGSFAEGSFVSIKESDFFQLPKEIYYQDIESYYAQFNHYYKNHYYPTNMQLRDY